MATGTALAVVVLQVGTLALAVVAVRRRDLAAAVNAAAAFVLALLPILVETVLARSVVFGPVLPVWLAAAGLLHSLGMLGLYESTWWWDHLTHTVSAGLVAALLYAGSLVALPGIAGIGGSYRTVVTVTVGGTLAIGIVWELLEVVAHEVGEWLDVEPMLIVYGWRDTVVDLGFDLVGAVVVLAADLRVFVPLFERSSEMARVVVAGSGWLLLGGPVAMALSISVVEAMRSRSGPPGRW